MWGDGDCGQLGLGEATTERYRPWPLHVGGKEGGILQVACGGMHTVVLTADGKLYSWGVNDEGALGRYTSGKIWETHAPAGSTPGDSYIPGLVHLPSSSSSDGGDGDGDGALRPVQISAGDSHTAVLLANGQVLLCGTFRDSSGVMGFRSDKRFQLTLVPVEVPVARGDRVCKIASGADHVVCLTSAGRVYTLGNGQQGQLGRVGERMSEAHKLSTMLRFAEAYVGAGGGMKKTGGGKRRRKVVDVCCGTYHTFATVDDGHVYACGLNNYGQLGIPGHEAPVYTLTQVEQLTGICPPFGGIKGAQHHSLAITKHGTLLTFGRPTYGRLGATAVDVGSDEPVWKAQRVDGLTGVTVLGCGGGLAVSGCFGTPMDLDAAPGEKKGPAAAAAAAAAAPAAPKMGQIWLWGMGSASLANGEDDDDVHLPQRVKETKKYNALQCVQLEFGGQHVACLAVERPGANRIRD